MSDYLVDNVNLDDPQGRWVVLRDTTLPRTGAPRLATVEVPGREGIAALAANGGGAGGVTLKFAITDRDAQGQPTRSRAQLWTNYELLLTVLKPRELVTLTMQPGGDAAKVRQVQARMSNALAPAYQGHVSGKSVITLEVVYETLGFWEAPTHVEYSITGIGAGKTVDLNAFQGATGWTAVSMIFTTPTEMVTVTDPVSGLTARWRRALTTWQSNPTNFLRLDLTDFDAGFVSSDAGWAEDGVNVTMGLDVPASGFRLRPTPGVGAYRVYVAGAASALLRVRKTYL